MESLRSPKTSKRFIAFLVDIILVFLVMQLVATIFKDQFENWFHAQALLDQYHEIGISMGVFDSSLNPISSVDSATVEAFNKAVSDIVIQYQNANFYITAISGSVGFIIFQFIVPLALGEGRSFGKLLMKLKVVKKDNSKITFVNLLLRNIIGVLLIEFVLSIKFMFLPLTISASLVLASMSHKALHDYIGGTLVVEVYDPATVVKKEDEKVNPYHKKFKGFEVIDEEGLKRQEAAKKSIDVQVKEKSSEIVNSQEVNNSQENNSEQNG